MRLTKEKILKASTAQLNDWIDEHIMAGHFSTANDLPNWSSDISAAWKVLEEFEEYHIRKYVSAANEFMFECVITIKDVSISHIHKNAPLAICKAALMAVMEENT